MLYIIHWVIFLNNMQYYHRRYYHILARFLESRTTWTELQWVWCWGPQLLVWMGCTRVLGDIWEYNTAMVSPQT